MNIKCKIVILVTTLSSSGIITFHKHSFGILEPSKEDINITYKIGNALKLIGKDYLDNLIIDCKGDLFLLQTNIQDSESIKCKKGG